MNHLRTLRLLEFSWLFICCGLWGIAQNTWASLRSSSLATSSYYYFEDHGGASDFAAIQSIDDFQWQEFDPLNPNFGYSSSTFWFKLDVKNLSNEAQSGILEVQYPILDRVEAYIVEGSENDPLIVMAAGDMVSFSEKPVLYRNPIFPINTAAQAQLTAYLKVKTTSSMQVPIKVWSEREFWQQSRSYERYQIVYFGIMSAMCFYNLFIFISYRDISYIHYVLFIFSYTTFQFSLQGLGMEVLWYDSPLMNTLSLPVSIGLSLYFASSFARSFLNVKNLSVNLDRAYRIVSYYCLAIVAASIISDAGVMVQIGVASAVPMALLCIFAGFFALSRKNPLGLFFSIAWIVFLAGTVLAALNKFGQIERNLVTEYSQQLGSCLETVLLSFALGYKMNLISKERYLAKKTAFEAQERLNLVQKEANQKLELKVAERTKQIKSILANIKQGIFTVSGQSATIDPDYSQFLKELFGLDKLGGQRFTSDLLKNYSRLSDDELSRIQTVFEFSIGEDQFAFEANSWTLPRELFLGQKDHDVKTIEIDWNPISDDQGTTERILITLRDVSDIRDLQQGIRFKDRMLKSQEIIFELGPSAVQNFINSANRLLLNIKDETLKNSLDKKKVKRDFHTLKGLSRQCKFDEISNIVHLQEDRFRDESYDTDEIDQAISEIEEHLDSAKDVLGKLTDAASQREMLSIQENFERSIDLLISTREASREAVDHLLQESGRSLKTIVKNSILEAYALGKSLKRCDFDIVIEGPTILFPFEHHEAINFSFSHLLRNCVDHGLEPESERISHEKPNRGRITISQSQDDSFFTISLKDDGRGMNLASIRKKIQGLGQPQPTSVQEQLNMIFSSGFSTSQKVNEISGRGVGMDAVKTYFQSLGGDITIQPQGEGFIEDENGYVRFQFRISIPREHSSSATERAS